jgi:UDP-glucose 4-epimerase
MRLLLTGGAGYIGSHTVLSALRAGHEAFILDDFSNSGPEVVEALRRASNSNIEMFQGDIRDTDRVREVLEEVRPDAILHFAGVKSVGESVERPRFYYDINVAGTLSLMEAMEDVGVRSLIFSSSATVYGDPQYLPIDENHPLSVTNPYGRSKLQVEDILRDQCLARPDWSVAILRYFNPVGADACGLIGESPRGVPANLMPYVADVAAGDREHVGVFGDDYDTRDGTGIRDYIHVSDLADAHVAAVKWTSQNTGARAFNLGGGQGTSVLEMIETFGKISGRPVPYRVMPRRPGDIASCYADPSRAAQELSWTVCRGIEEMCESAWKWRASVLSST